MAYMVVIQVLLVLNALWDLAASVCIIKALADDEAAWRAREATAVGLSERQPLAPIMEEGPWEEVVLREEPEVRCSAPVSSASISDMYVGLWAYAASAKNPAARETLAWLVTCLGVMRAAGCVDPRRYGGIAAASYAVEGMFFGLQCVHGRMYPRRATAIAVLSFVFMGLAIVSQYIQ